MNVSHMVPIIVIVVNVSHMAVYIDHHALHGINVCIMNTWYMYSPSSIGHNSMANQGYLIRPDTCGQCMHTHMFESEY